MKRRLRREQGNGGTGRDRGGGFCWEEEGSAAVSSAVMNKGALLVGVCPHPGPPCLTGTPSASPLFTSALQPFMPLMVLTDAGAGCSV